MAIRPIDAHALALTEEQLEKKIGDPIWIQSERRAEWMILWGYHPPEVYGRAFIFTRRTAQKEQFQFSELGVTWNAYAYPPAHIDREAWTAEWISVKDRLPGEKQRVIVRCSTIGTTVGWILWGEWMTDLGRGCSNVTHWMPLPEAPTEQ